MAKVFISYSHQDEDWKDRVVKHLSVLAGLGIEVWDDRRISAGADWEAEIAKAIATCDVALLLVSADFLTSRFILGQELPPLLQRRREQGIRVIPVVVAACAWNRVPWLAALAARPKDGKPLASLSRPAAEAALAALAGEVADLLLTPSSKASSIPSARPPGAPGPGAAAIWREKLEYLQAQEAVSASPALRFELRHQIEECRAKLRELGVEP